jgi:hydrogenase maturation factor
MSRLHRVVGVPEPGVAEVEDLDGIVHRVSLLALDGPRPALGEWLVVHSGYAVDRVEEAQADAVLVTLRGAPGARNEVPER